MEDNLIFDEVRTAYEKGVSEERKRIVDFLQTRQDKIFHRPEYVDAEDIEDLSIRDKARFEEIESIKSLIGSRHNGDKELMVNKCKNCGSVLTNKYLAFCDKHCHFQFYEEKSDYELNTEFADEVTSSHKGEKK